MMYAVAEVVFYASRCGRQRPRAGRDVRRHPQRATAHERDRVPERLRVRNGDRLRPRPGHRSGGSRSVRLARDVQGGGHARPRPGPARGRGRGSGRRCRRDRRHGAVARRRSSTGSATWVPRRRSPWRDFSVSEGPNGSCSRSSPWPQSPARACATSSMLPWSGCTSPCPPCSSRFRSASWSSPGERAAAILLRGQSWVSEHSTGLRRWLSILIGGALVVDGLLRLLI